MQRTLWKWIIAGSLGFNCLLALILLNVLSAWGMSPAWMMLFAVLLLSAGSVLIRAWFLEPQKSEADQTVTRFTLLQDGFPRAQMVFTLEPLLEDWPGSESPQEHREEHYPVADEESGDPRVI